MEIDDPSFTTKKEQRENAKKVHGISIKQSIIADQMNAGYKDTSEYIEFLKKQSDMISEVFSFINSDATRRKQYEEFLIKKKEIKI